MCTKFQVFNVFSLVRGEAQTNTQIYEQAKVPVPPALVTWTRKFIFLKEKYTEGVPQKIKSTIL